MKRNIPLIIYMLFTLAACQKELSFENAGPGSPAQGTLKDASGNCMRYTVHGTWYNGVKPGDTNYVDISVHVTRAGNYQIRTDAQNGVSFTGTGVFADTGLNTVRLIPSGTFTQHIASSFTTSYGGDACLFTIMVQDSTGTGLGSGGGTGGGSGGTGGGTAGGTVGLNAWQFTSNGHLYNGDAVAVVTTIPNFGTLLAISGTMASGSMDTTMTISIVLPGATPSAGTFKTSTPLNTLQMITLTAGGTGVSTIFGADASVSSKVITFKITGYDATTKVVTGTFDGTARNASGGSAAITGGAFKAEVSFQ